MKIKTQNLTGEALDWAVQKILFARQDYVKPWVLERHAAGDPCGSASTDWAQGGPIIEREKLDLTYWPNKSEDQRWLCEHNDIQGCKATGPTPLAAAMRAVCLAYLGEEVELPEGLKMVEIKCMEGK